MVKEIIRRSKFVNYIYYGLKLDDMIALTGLFGFNKRVESSIQGELSKGKLGGGVNLNTLRKDMKRCYVKYKALPSEYFLFDFQNRSDDDKATYVTDTYINSNLGRIVGRKHHDVQLNDKYNFYKLMEPFFKRKAIRVNGVSDYNVFEEFALACKSLICKPNESSVGFGIFAANVNSSYECKQVFQKMLGCCKYWIVEELLQQVDEMAKFNESSINTVRVSAFLIRKGFFPLSSVIRTGRAGSVVDNAGRGGVSAAIDVNTGEIISDGMDKEGNWYVCHPDSNTPFKGSVIPEWPALMKIIEEAHRTIPNQIYVGWDFALTPNGWALIEGNWGQLGAQQVALGHGLRPKFDEYLAAGVLKDGKE